MNMYIPTEEDRKRFRDIELCVVTPSSDYNVSVRFSRALANMVAYSWLNGLRISTVGGTERTVVDWARNDIAKKVLAGRNEYTGGAFTHMLWIDDDQVFNPDMAVALARHDVDMVSGLYFGRTAPHHPVAYIKDDSKDPYKHFPLTDVPATLFEIDAAGFGAMFMRVDVFKRVPEPWFTLDWRAGEDIAFCVEARKHGVKMFCDGTYRLGHIGDPQIVTEETYETYRKQHPELMEGKVRVGLAKRSVA